MCHTRPCHRGKVKGIRVRQVKALAQHHIEELDRKAKELLAMKSTLEHRVHCCHEDERPECPILDGLAREGVPLGVPSGAVV
jgi:MerR family copper efflux transcriptional regulator